MTANSDSTYIHHTAGNAHLDCMGVVMGPLCSSDQ